MTPTELEIHGLMRRYQLPRGVVEWCLAIVVDPVLYLTGYKQILDLQYGNL